MYTQDMSAGSPLHHIGNLLCFLYCQLVICRSGSSIEEMASQTVARLFVKGTWPMRSAQLGVYLLVLPAWPCSLQNTDE